MLLTLVHWRIGHSVVDMFESCLKKLAPNHLAVILQLFLIFFFLFYSMNCIESLSLFFF